MNQILITNLKRQNKKFWIYFQFIFSIFLLLIVFISFLFYKIYLNNKEQESNQLKSNYLITQLYNSNNNNIKPPDNLFGIIDIPKISINYPVFSYLEDSLLKIAPCKFYGDSPKINRKFMYCCT